MPKNYTIIVHNCAECPESITADYGKKLICGAADPMRTCPEKGLPSWCPLPDEERDTTATWIQELNAWVSIKDDKIFLYADKLQKDLIDSYPLFRESIADGK